MHARSRAFTQHILVGALALGRRVSGPTTHTRVNTTPACCFNFRLQPPTRNHNPPRLLCFSGSPSTFLLPPSTPVEPDFTPENDELPLHTIPACPALVSLGPQKCFGHRTQAERRASDLAPSTFRQEEKKTFRPRHHP
ncbi:hypothetical protein BS50DRAFT_385744 [Corynespora cassiicola Philippines]|uniref:Uncharacterized protein n=1 Tax=Corynespora cassiicola Philippines TaxID=1448308 RepID=A0A2T2NP76_CORCC|nr:hypothetical protein BS50DRAFT_385744 [Corynespora cassiicola Philippines]